MQKRLRLLADRLFWALDGWRTRAAFFITAEVPSRVRAHGVALRSLGKDAATALAATKLPEWQFWIVLVAATAAMAIIRANVPFWFGGMDHADYYWYGRFLLGDNFVIYPIPPSWRTPGMGIFHILSGTLLFDTWKGFIALFAVFSVAIPVFYYLIVRPHSRAFALLAGLAVTLSMTPFVYANVANNDQLYFFLHALLLLLCVRYFQSHVHEGTAALAAIVVVAAYANLVRPVGALIFWIFIALTVVLRRRDWRRLAAASGVYMLLMSGWVLWDRAYGTNGGFTIGLSFPQPTGFSTTAERRLAEAYFSRSLALHPRSDQAAEGYAASQKLRALLRDFLVTHPHEWQTVTLFTPPSLFAAGADKPDAADRLLDALFSDRNTLYFGFIVRTTESVLGVADGLSLLYDVASEHGTTGLKGVVGSLLANPKQLLFGVTPNLAGRTTFALLYLSRYRERVMPIATIQQIPDPLLTPDLGPATALILKTLRRFFDDYPQYLPPQMHDDPERAYRNLVAGYGEDAVFEEGFIYEVLNWYIGSALTGDTYRAATMEILRRYPKMAMLMYENFLDFTVIRRLGLVAAPLDRAALDASSDAYFETRRQAVDGLTPGLTRELTQVFTANEVWKDVVALHWLFYLIAPAFVYLLIAALPFLRDPAVLAPCLFLLLNYLFDVMSIAVFSPWGAPRYEANFYLLPLVISCMIFGRLSSKIRKCGSVKVGDAHACAPGADV